MRKTITRRTLLGGGLAATLGVATYPALFRCREVEQAPKLRRDPAGVLDLPEHFTYQVLEAAGMPMSDGYRVPGRPDGMACFQHGDHLVLMRNHELSPRDWRQGPYARGQLPVAESYRSDCPGGVTRLVLDPHALQRHSSNLVLTGTSRNCAGGPSPWGWLSCEESVAPGHGYVFLCPIDAEKVAAARPLPCYGRFNHEAIAIDPTSAIAFLTEDRPDGCLYRFLPDDPRQPFVGRLQALRVVGDPACDTGSSWRVGERKLIDWVDLPDIDPQQDMLRHAAVARGAAILRRGEGIWYADGKVYACATSGGPIERGQIFELGPTTGSAPATLTLIAQAEPPATFDMPDNITVAPWGDLYVAEDGCRGRHLRTITPDGKVRAFARNALSSSEFAGVCFSPDGSALFVNMQEDGLTLAITGPFSSWLQVDDTSLTPASPG